MKEPEQTLEYEFKDLHLNLPVLEVLAHGPVYNEILDKYVESLELGKNGSAFIQGEMPKKIKDPRLFTLPCRLGDSKPFDTLANLGSCVILIPLYLFKKLKIRLLEETDHVFGLADGTKKKESYKPQPTTDGISARPPYYAKQDFMDYHFPREWESTRDAELNPFKDVLVFRKMVEFLGTILINPKGNMWESEELIEKRIDWNMPPKEGDGAWHIMIELINPDREKFNKTFQSIYTIRKLSEKANLSEIIDLYHFHSS
ncbi:hypothetical protein Tco_0860847 [Tanacetum coccineum]|uniref:Uncharacterized protein n=1 Tax=Tanacetum coccineum TaxID=301880 RepID=A0ABQ5BG34_9ASTR